MIVLSMMHRIRAWHWARTRALDLKILWPICVDQAPDLDIARAVFMYHCIRDPAWIEHYGEDKLIEVIGNLEPLG